uniref:Reverse transcriptase domain-containing protein n=1 Tax=Graphocephala atropunctata TaxID=36148 RepID=A0A1B6LAY2_9HEMI
MILKENETSIVCLSEHFLHEDEISLFVPNGFVTASYYSRKPPLQCGGSSIIIDSRFKFEAIDVSAFCVNSLCEASVIFLSDFNLIILNVYRTPDSDFNSFIVILERLICFLMHKKCKYFALTGDLNVDILKFDCDNEVRFFVNTLRSMNLYSNHCLPTRNKACLDIMFSNVDKDLCTCTLLKQDIISDHAGVFVNINLNLNCDKSIEEVPEVKMKRLLSPVRLGNFKDTLMYNVDWPFLNNSLNVNESCSAILNILTYYLNLHCPMINVKKKQNRKVKLNWVTPEIELIKSYMLIFYDKWKSSLSLDDKDRFMRVKKLYNKAIAEAKKTANDTLLTKSKNKCKTAWQIVRNEAGSFIGPGKKNAIPLSPEVLNDHFVNVPVRLSSYFKGNDGNYCNMLNKYSRPQNTIENDFKWKVLDPQLVRDVVMNLSSSRSEDIYGFSNYVFKQIVDAILLPLTCLINAVLTVGVFPDALKYSKVTPIFKKGQKESPENYRPITIIPILSKIIESCMFKQLYEFFQVNNLFCKYQFGFRPRHSTSMAVESIVNEILNGLENKLVIGTTFIDLTKAFDLVDHSILLKKLDYYGIRKKELGLIESYLMSRMQMVSINNVSSSFKNIVAGVPQGSVLGPLLFLVFVNDFSNNVSSLSFLYADDTTLLCSDFDYCALNLKLINSLQQAKEWYFANKLIINDSKTDSLIFTNRTNIEINDDLVKPVKLLGIFLDSKLSWETHVDSVCKKLSRVIFLLRKLKHCVNFEVLLMTYFGLFHVHLNYGARLWGNSSAANKAFLWQKKAIRVMANLSPQESCRQSFSNFKIMPLACIFILQNLVYVKKNINVYVSHDSIHDHNTRFRHNLVLPNVRLTKTYNSFSFQQIRLFNKLPIDIRELPPGMFESKMSSWLKFKAFYSIEEFMNCDTFNLF